MRDLCPAQSCADGLGSGSPLLAAAAQEPRSVSVALSRDFVGYVVSEGLRAVHAGGLPVRVLLTAAYGLISPVFVLVSRLRGDPLDRGGKPRWVPRRVDQPDMDTARKGY